MGTTLGKYLRIQWNLCAHDRHRLVPRRPPRFRPSRPPQPPNRTHPLRSFTCSTTRRRAFGRSAARAMVAGAVAARPAGPACERGHRWCCARGLRRGHRRAGSRGRRRSGTGTRSHRRRTGRWKMRCAAALPRSVSSRIAFPATCWLRQPDPQQGESRPARVHPVLAAGAGAGRSAEAAACAEAVERPGQPRKRRAGRLEARTGQAGLGRRLRDTWQPGEAAAQARLKAFLDGGIAGYSGDRDRPDRDGTSRPRRIFGSARSVRVRSGMPRASPRPSTSPVHRHRKFLSELGWREFCRHLLFDVPDLARATCSPISTVFHGSRMPRHCRHGSAARPAIQSSMPACANSGTPA